MSVLYTAESSIDIVAPACIVLHSLLRPAPLRRGRPSGRSVNYGCKRQKKAPPSLNTWCITVGLSYGDANCSECLTVALCKDVQFRKGDAYPAIYASAIVAFVIGTVRIYELGFVEQYLVSNSDV